MNEEFGYSDQRVDYIREIGFKEAVEILDYIFSVQITQIGQDSVIQYLYDETKNLNIIIHGTQRNMNKIEESKGKEKAAGVMSTLERNIPARKTEILDFMIQKLNSEDYNLADLERNELISKIGKLKDRVWKAMYISMEVNYNATGKAPFESSVFGKRFG
ncbi:hypothetical protein [Methanolapillus millepedarum]|uniref:Uncharacterized protein n=1 Tax=Methanolapillus millepedarum TaxID=3028296 RepID=A0AA96V430_9EURY|nr:hypothetical protein MsAc7_17320 [Methanosarcinaceae archaeon Ac7]